MKNIVITVTPLAAGSVDIVLEGELILKYLQEVIEQITSTINQHTAIALKLRNIVQIDLACIQLILSIKHSAGTANKTFACEIELPGEIKTVLANAGLAGLADLINTAAR